ncbi:hypothetical protein G9A89_022242 [Geosiphon pyriformis]|nr:hypothetical protein G9A89_022242 [Geosiphon pyriformis]
MVDMTEEIRKMEITDNIHSLAQQIFQLIQHQEMEITINQQTIYYKNTAKISQNKAQKRLENVVNKITQKTYQKNLDLLFDTTILQQLEHFVGKNNLTTQARAIYQIHTAFQDRPEILLNKAIDTVTSNQLGKITNAQFEELQTQITQVILENKIQKILQEEELNKRYGLLIRGLPATKLKKKLTDLQVWEAMDNTTIESLSIIQKTPSKPSDTTLQIINDKNSFEH